MPAPEQLLRASFIPGRIHDDFLFSPPYVAEMVAVNGVERVRGYYITSTRTRTPFFSQRSCRLRPQTVYEWARLTGERLTSDLQPIVKERS